MIRSFRSKPLKQFAATGKADKLPVPNIARIRRILIALDAASKPDDLNLPGFGFHGLNGKPKRYAVGASGNYRITYGFYQTDAIDVDLEDYH